MIIWRGLGFLVLILTVVAVLAAQFVTQRAFGETYWEQQAWPAAAALGLAAVLCWFLGRRLNKPASKDAGEHRRTWTHDLFFVRMEWWAFPLVALAIAGVVLNFTPGSAARSAKAAASDTAKLTNSK